MASWQPLDPWFYITNMPLVYITNILMQFWSHRNDIFKLLRVFFLKLENKHWQNSKSFLWEYAHLGELLAMLDSHWYLINLYLINNVEDIVVFSGFKNVNFDNSFMCFWSRKVQVTFVANSQLTIIIFQYYKHGTDKVLRLPLWIGHCHLCMKGYLKVHLQSP